MADPHTEMPEMVRLDPDYAGFGRQVVGWADDAEDAPQDWPEYIRADLIPEPALHVRANTLDAPSQATPTRRGKGIPKINLTYEEDVVRTLIAEAVAKERERCAVIADQWATPAQRKHGNGGPAAAIRATPPAQQE